MDMNLPRMPKGYVWLGTMCWGGNGEKTVSGFVAGVVRLSTDEFEPDEYVWLDAEGWHEQGEPSRNQIKFMKSLIKKHPNFLEMG